MTNTLAGWKLLVVALAGYSIFVTRKLLELTDAAYRLAHEASFRGIDTEHGLEDTRWGAEALGQIRFGMYLLAALVAVAVIAELVSARRRPALPDGPRPPAT